MPVDKRKKDELFLPQNRVDAAMARIETSTILLEIVVDTLPQYTFLAWR